MNCLPEDVAFVRPTLHRAASYCLSMPNWQTSSSLQQAKACPTSGKMTHTRIAFQGLKEKPIHHMSTLLYQDAGRRFPPHLPPRLPRVPSLAVAEIPSVAAEIVPHTEGRYSVFVVQLAVRAFYAGNATDLAIDKDDMGKKRMSEGCHGSDGLFHAGQAATLAIDNYDLMKGLGNLVRDMWMFRRLGLGRRGGGGYRWKERSTPYGGRRSHSITALKRNRASKVILVGWSEGLTGGVQMVLQRDLGRNGVPCRHATDAPTGQTADPSFVAGLLWGVLSQRTEEFPSR